MDHDTENKYVNRSVPDHPRAVKSGRAIGEHVLIAEIALGHYLPDGAEVHHVNGIRSDNRNCNLVICHDRRYHRLLHVRQAALKACGHVDWRKCKFCKAYAPITDLQMGITRRNGYEPSPYHNACQAKYRRDRRIAAGLSTYTGEVPRYKKPCRPGLRQGVPLSGQAIVPAARTTNGMPYASHR